jgi:DNA-binding NarL/FixJ family response regulator
MALTTLIVDDHSLFRSTARMLLESEGYLVVGEAADGAEAVSAAGVLHPDLVVLDVHLPDSTGFDVSHRLFDEGFAGRVVLVSSRAASEYGELVGDSGAIGFIAKDELSGASLARLLDRGDRHACTPD